MNQIPFYTKEGKEVLINQAELESTESIEYIELILEQNDLIVLSRQRLELILNSLYIKLWDNHLKTV